MNTMVKGMIAGLAATAVISLLMLMKTAMGLMPELNVISMLSSMMNSSAAMGWMAHFVIGTVAFGGLFALIESKLPGGALWLKGVIFGIGAWVLMMLAVMPMAGAGVFGMTLGIGAPLMTLMLHAIYGAVLGGVYAALQPMGHTLQHAHR